MLLFALALVLTVALMLLLLVAQGRKGPALLPRIAAADGRSSVFNDKMSLFYISPNFSLRPYST